MVSGYTCCQPGFTLSLYILQYTKDIPCSHADSWGFESGKEESGNEPRDIFLHYRYARSLWSLPVRYADIISRSLSSSCCLSGSLRPLEEDGEGYSVPIIYERQGERERLQE